VWALHRKDHFGDDTMWLVTAINTEAVWNCWVNARDCTLLDPALDVLFERKKNG
jgi:hypothetical protein